MSPALVGWLLIIGGALCWLLHDVLQRVRWRRTRQAGDWQPPAAPLWMRAINPLGLVLAGVGAVYLIGLYV